LEKNFALIPVAGIVLEVILLAFAALISTGIAYGILALNGHNTNFFYNPHDQVHIVWQAIGYLGLFIFLLISSFVYSLVFGAIVHGASERFKGNNPDLKSCFSASYRKKKPLFLFSLLSAIVGTVLRFFEDKGTWAEKFATNLIGAAWSFGSMFAVPFIMASEKPIGPIDATRDSVKLIKKYGARV
jgi:magnesium-transporting ATPase (P-type)